VQESVHQEMMCSLFLVFWRQCHAKNGVLSTESGYCKVTCPGVAYTRKFKHGQQALEQKNEPLACKCWQIEVNVSSESSQVRVRDGRFESHHGC